MPRRIDIRDSGTLEYHEAFYAQMEADALFEKLRAETPWQQERAAWGRSRG